MRIVQLVVDCMHCLVRMEGHGEWESNGRGLKVTDSLSF